MTRPKRPTLAEPESTAQRIARLTEMARRVWPEEWAEVREWDESTTFKKGAAVFANGCELLIATHPRALDMLEAALERALEPSAPPPA